MTLGDLFTPTELVKSLRTVQGYSPFEAKATHRRLDAYAQELSPLFANASEFVFAMGMLEAIRRIVVEK